MILTVKKLLEHFTKKSWKKATTTTTTATAKKQTKKEFRVEKVFKRKGDKLYVKWKGYNNSFNNWIGKKDTIK